MKVIGLSIDASFLADCVIANRVAVKIAHDTGMQLSTTQILTLISKIARIADKATANLDHTEIAFEVKDER